MFKIICNEISCNNKNVIYYMPDATDPTLCGGCKNNLKPIKMNKTEYEKVFDYDPFEIKTII